VAQAKQAVAPAAPAAQTAPTTAPAAPQAARREAEEKPASTRVGAARGSEEIERKLSRLERALASALERGSPIPQETPVSGREGEFTLEKLAGLIRLIYELQVRVPPEYLMGLAEILAETGLIDSSQKEALKKLIQLAKLGYEHGLGVDESIAILAALSKELGLDVTSITEELVKAILKRRGESDWESPPH
ncbi:MAG: hypothetical protein F7C34_00330, partial [Desulfurococcales archaeon]|nr:hypothetical protein [Desulfurococcales archaeon]